MKILIISKEVWRNDQNGGNTLSSFFGTFPSDTEFAQIFCSEGEPNNTICHNYFKLSTSVLVSAIKKGDLPEECHFVTRNTANSDKDICSYNSKGCDSCTVGSHTTPIISSGHNKTSIRNIFSGVFNREIFREVIWLSRKYKSSKLHDYIVSFNPDIIFAPGYGVHYMNTLIQWVASFITCPIVSLISDDYYTYSLRSFNPFYWLNQPFLRHNVRHSAHIYDLVYTMSNTQKRELEKDLHVKTKVLLKNASFDNYNGNKQVHSPIRLIYAGSLYSNRWKTLRTLVKVINDINYEIGSIAISLDIYSGSVLNAKYSAFFNNSNSCRLHPSVPFDALMEFYDDYDIALHVEGFDIRSKAKVRMSFSTKIIDCLASGCATMCICENRQGGYAYISSNDLGICIDSPSKIKESLMRIISDPSIINRYREKAHEFGLAHHNSTDVSIATYKEFCELINKQ